VRLFIRGIPFHTTKEEIQELCSRFGKVSSVDVIPQKQFGFVTFAAKEEATLAVYGLQQQLFKGAYLQVDWAKKRKDEEKKDTAKSVNAAGTAVPVSKEIKGSKVETKGSKVETKPVPEVPVDTTPRYIPGADEVEETINKSTATKSNVTKQTLTNKSKKQNTPVPTKKQGRSVSVSPYTETYKRN
jgi:RNA recognition motif-containing protein